MLYMSLPLASHGSWSFPRYGLRVGEFHKRPTTTQLVAAAPVQHELIDFRIVASDVGIEFGRRLVWDIPRGVFGPQSNPATVAIGVPIKVSDPVNRQPWDPPPSAMSASAANAMRTWQIDGQSVVLVKAIIPAHWTATDRRTAALQLGPILRVVNSQQTDAWLAPRSAEAQ
jgi:hypothetical protein